MPQAAQYAAGERGLADTELAAQEDQFAAESGTKRSAPVQGGGGIR